VCRKRHEPAEAPVPRDGGDLIPRSVSQVNAQGRLAAATELPAGEQIDGIVNGGRDVALGKVGILMRFTIAFVVTVTVALTPGAPVSRPEPSLSSSRKSCEIQPLDFGGLF
jgi:hypothetical protein